MRSKVQLVQKFERQDSHCSLQHSVVLCIWELCECLDPILLGIGGQCPAHCKYPSSHVANCASLDLKIIPKESCRCNVLGNDVLLLCMVINKTSKFINIIIIIIQYGCLLSQAFSSRYFS